MEENQEHKQEDAEIRGLCGHGAQESCAPTKARETQEKIQERRQECLCHHNGKMGRRYLFGALAAERTAGQL